MNSWGKGDIIGCGLDFMNHEIFYTFNGNLVGPAFHNVKISSEECSLLYATVSFGN